MSTGRAVMEAVPSEGDTKLDGISRTLSGGSGCVCLKGKGVNWVKRREQNHCQRECQRKVKEMGWKS